MKAQLPATAAQRTCRAFTLLELLVSLAVLGLIILLVAQMLGPASAISGTGNKHIDTDTQARVILDRMAVDFAQMLKRTDVDYYLKAPTGYKNPNPHGKNIKLTGGAQKGNDQVAFFSQTLGYNDTSSSWQSPISLVAYRVNGNPNSPSYLKLERMGKGLLWNGVNNGTSSNSPYPIVFLPGQIAPGNSPWNQQWYGAVNNDTSAKSSDPDYQTIGPGVFRLEYYYLRKDGSIKDVPALTWDATQTVSANLNAFSDVESIVVAIAVIDPATRSMISPATLVNMLSDMADFKDANGNGIGAQKIGDLENNWNLAVQSAASTGTTSDGSPFPPAAASAIRVYNRYFDLRTLAQF
jgi:prepilin-type N-terminal cleavage/methylation domain-containing protein